MTEIHFRGKHDVQIINYSGVFFFMFLTFGFTSAALDVAGEGELSQSSPRGERTPTIHCEQGGNALVVTMERFRGDEMTGEGAIEGDKIF